MLDRDEWVIVRWWDGGLLIRKRYQWEPTSRHNPHKWSYVATGLTEKEADNYRKLLKE